jgi:hypothetical protein
LEIYFLSIRRKDSFSSPLIASDWQWMFLEKSGTPKFPLLDRRGVLDKRKYIV